MDDDESEQRCCGKTMVLDHDSCISCVVCGKCNYSVVIYATAYHESVNNYTMKRKRKYIPRKKKKIKDIDNDETDALIHLGS